MPVQTIEIITKREAAISKRFAEKAEGMDPATKRSKRKQIKRAQRKRRRLAADAARRAPKPAKSDS